MTFRNPQESHEHSLQTLNALYEYDDFMQSIRTMVDLGCGTGLDLEWWATRTTRDDIPEPLNIRCTGVDTLDEVLIAKQYNNIVYQKNNFENRNGFSKKSSFDVLWCHDAFQYCVDPIGTLASWRDIAANGAMLILILPQTLQVEKKQLSFYQESGCYYHHTLVSLIHMLAVTGWDCSSGFFKKNPDDPWLHAVAYKSEHAPRDLRTTSWHDLADLKLLPESVEKSIQRHNKVCQQDLVLPWIDKSFTWLGKQ